MSKKVTIPAEDAKEDIKKIFDINKKLISNENNNEKVKPINEINKKWDMNDRIINLFIDNISTDQNLRQKYAVILIVIFTLELIAKD